MKWRKTDEMKQKKKEEKNLRSVGCDKDTESFITSRSCDNIEARTRAHTHTFSQKKFSTGNGKRFVEYG